MHNSDCNSLISMTQADPKGGKTSHKGEFKAKKLRLQTKIYV